MRTTLFALAWAFILVVAAYDVSFAWHYRAGFAAWELNPVARWVAALYGLGTVFAFRVAVILFAAGLAIYCHRRRHRLAVPYTLVMGGMHLLLSLHYLVGHLD
jgi:hypothetical protein